MTTLQTNAMLGMVAIIVVAFGLGWMLLQNDLAAERFMFIGSLLKDCILAIVAITWYFAKKQPPEPDPEQSDDRRNNRTDP